MILGASGRSPQPKQVNPSFQNVDWFVKGPTAPDNFHPSILVNPALFKSWNSTNNLFFNKLKPLCRSRNWSSLWQCTSVINIRQCRRETR
eukprot:9036295-Karenia_brevis.AAC.1